MARNTSTGNPSDPPRFGFRNGLASSVVRASQENVAYQIRRNGWASVLKTTRSKSSWRLILFRPGEDYFAGGVADACRDQAGSEMFQPPPSAL